MVQDYDDSQPSSARPRWAELPLNDGDLSGTFSLAVRDTAPSDMPDGDLWNPDALDLEQMCKDQEVIERLADDSIRCRPKNGGCHCSPKSSPIPEDEGPEWPGEFHPGLIPTHNGPRGEGGCLSIGASDLETCNAHCKRQVGVKKCAQGRDQNRPPDCPVGSKT